MIKDCQQFEERIQELMDSHIDPETDESLCAHSADCASCYESLMAFSLLHTNYLNDSDSMKIKLENLGLQEIYRRNAEKKPERKHIWAVFASLAAMLLVLVALTNQLFEQPTESPMATSRLTETVKNQELTNVNFESLVKIKESLDRNEIYVSLSELPGLHPFKTIAYCLDWFQQSWFSPPAPDPDSPDLGLQIQIDLDRQYSGFMKLAHCS